MPTISGHDVTLVTGFERRPKAVIEPSLRASVASQLYRVHMSTELTTARILEVTERLMATMDDPDRITVRRIAAAAGVAVSAINYHFGSREALMVAAMARCYTRFNAERLNQLTAAVDAARPSPPPLDAVLTALLEPSVRWRYDPASDYRVFLNFRAITRRSADPTLGRALAEEVDHLGLFLDVLARIAPHLNRAELGWRLHATLGIRDNVLRNRTRLVALAGTAIDPDDPARVLAELVAMTRCLFLAPAGGVGRGMRR
ncbi:TetR family transcriptional regulator [Tistrella mobilis]|uniref:TetR family transcriptional regulator n=1 Tax=Tistrella mobilis TaxID=171437 RepID=UPI003558F9F8